MIDAATYRLVESIPVGGQLHNVYVTPDGNTPSPAPSPTTQSRCSIWPLISPPGECGFESGCTADGHRGEPRWLDQADFHRTL